MKTKENIDILLVEDNDGDVLLTKKAFQHTKIPSKITVAKDGEIAIDMLKRNPGYEGFSLPDMILLDINLPKKDGRQVLREIKDDPDLKRIPVIVLTSSKAEQDILKSYDLFASGYIVKPVNIEDLFEIVSAIRDFWFNAVLLPEGRDHNKPDQKK